MKYLKFILFATLVLTQKDANCFHNQDYIISTQSVSLAITLCTLTFTPILAYAIYGDCCKSKKPNVIVEKPKLPSRRAAKLKSEQATSLNNNIDPRIAAMIHARQKEQAEIQQIRAEHDARIDQQLQRQEELKNQPHRGKAHKKK